MHAPLMSGDVKARRRRFFERKMADFTGFPLRIGACGALKLPLDVREQVTVTAERRPTDRLGRQSRSRELGRFLWGSASGNRYGPVALCVVL